MVENIILNYDIWENTGTDIKTYLLEQTNNLILREKLLFSKNEPFASLLFLLFKHSPDAWGESDEMLAVIQKTLFSQLFSLATPGDVPAFVKCLSPAHGLRKVRNLLYVISKYQNTAKNKSIFNKYLSSKDCEEVSQSEELVAALFGIIDEAIATREKEIMEEVIVYCVNILFSFDLDRVVRKMLRPSFKSAEEKDKAGKYNDAVIEYLKLHIENVPADKAILEFLVLVPTNEENGPHKYEKGYLGEKVYEKLFERVEKTIPGDERKADPKAVNNYCTTFYKAMLKNAGAFEMSVCNKLFTDMEKYRRKLPLEVREVGIHASKYLCRDEYLTNTKVKDLIEYLVIKFLKHKLCKREARNLLFTLFARIERTSPPVFIELFLKLTKSLAKSVRSLQSHEALYGLLQMLYTLENYAMDNPEVLGQEDFAKVLARLVYVLDRTGNLYFWQPSFDRSLIQHDPSPKDIKGSQREGGVVRIVLRLIFASLVKVQNKAPELLIHTLNFFIFHDKEACYKLSEILGKPFEKPAEAGIGFIECSVSGNKKVGHLMREKVKVIVGDKSEVQKKTISGLTPFDSDAYDSLTFRFLILAHYLSQALIYDIFRVSSYAEIAEEVLDKREFANEKLSAKSQGLLSIIGRLFCDYGHEISTSAEIGKRGMKELVGDITECRSDLDIYTSSSLDSLSTGSPVSIIKRRGSQKIYPSTPMHTKSTHIETFLQSPEEVKGSQFQAALEDSIKRIANLWKSKKGATDSYYREARDEIISYYYILVIQPGLCKLVATTLYLIASAIGKFRRSERSSARSERRGIKRGGVREELRKTSKARKSSTPPIQKIPDLYSAYEEYRHSVLSGRVLKRVSSLDKKVFAIVASKYKKLLGECPLHKKLVQRKCYVVPRNAFNTFVTLSSARDNLNRAMRLKPLKNPLRYLSILRGISFMRLCFLKRVFTAKLLAASNPTAKHRLYNKDFFVPNKASKVLLKALLTSREPKATPGNTETQETRNRDRLESSGKFGVKLADTRESGNASAARFEGDIIKLDTSMFGHFYIYSDRIVYEKGEKNMKNGRYRLGPLLRQEQKVGKAQRVWKFSEIEQILMSRYNHFRQALEIFLHNRKSVFIALYSEKNLDEFWRELKSRLSKSSVRLIDESAKKSEIIAARDDWRKMKISTFDYLMRLNMYAGRSFSVISQYPVFPWVVKNYSYPQLNFSDDIYRDLQFPAAAITQSKRDDATAKRQATINDGTGEYQHGTHYLPGRGVLEYLMRLQPFMELKDDFDSGGNCASRHFHYIERMWHIVLTDNSMSLELIPEFFYLPEFLANLYLLTNPRNNLNFGCKVLENDSYGLKGKKVRVDSVVIPPWARNNHHFIYLNYKALEQNATHREIPHWIDLIFGCRQHSEEAFNLFRPLTSEAEAWKREASGEKLTEGDVMTIKEFGHNPAQVFEKPQVAFSSRTGENMSIWRNVVFQAEPVSRVLTIDATSHDTSPLRYEDNVQHAHDIDGQQVLHHHKQPQHPHLQKVLPANRKFTKENKIKLKRKLAELPSTFPLFDDKRNLFSHNPLNVFAFAFGLLVVARTKDSCFHVYCLRTFKKLEVVCFHQVGFGLFGRVLLLQCAQTKRPES